MWYSKIEMKKIGLSFGVLLCFALFVLSFPFVNFASAENTTESSFLSKQLIEQIGEDSHSLFSNLSNAQVATESYEYYKDGVKHTTKSVVERVLTDALSNIYSASGRGSYVLNEDLKALSEAVNLYVSLNVGLLSLGRSERDNVDFTITVGQQQKTVTSSAVHEYAAYRPDFVETEKILIDGQNQIDFNFSTKTGYGPDESSKGFLIFDPTLNFSAELDSVTVLTEGREVFSGEKIQLSAKNALSSLSGGSLIKNLKEYFAIEWEVVSGEAEVEGNILTINSSSGSVLVRAKCKKSTDSEEYIYSQPIEFTVSNLAGVGVVSNFENSFSNVTLSNETLRLTLSNEFVIDKILTDAGQEVSFSLSGQNVTIQNINPNLKQNLTLVLKKTLEIEKIEVANKVYDSTNNATIVEIITNAEVGHKIYVTGLVANFENSSANGNANVLISGTPVLSGEDSNLYVLSEQLTDESGALIDGKLTAAAEIYQRQITVIAQETSKEFGEADPEIQYQIKGILPQDSLSGSLSREHSQDERIGEYRITIGTLANENYQIFLISNIFEITKRMLEVVNIIIEDREYDQTTTITTGESSFQTDGTQTVYKNGYLTIIFNTADVLGDFSEIKIVAQAQYLSASAGNGKEVSLEKLYLENPSAASYVLINNITSTGNILPRKIEVSGVDNSKQFGFEDPKLTYETTQLLPGDTLSGDVQRQNGESVGNYVIGVGTLSNPNYEIIFTPANFEITPREIQIEIQSKIKQYLDSDPKLTYTITSGSEVEGFSLDVVLKRGQGETTGDYPIEVVSYNTECYLITKITKGNLTIIKRDVTVQIEILDREFDSTTAAKISSKFTNLPGNNPDNIRVNSGLSAKFQDENIGVWPITYYFGGEVVSSFNQEVMEGNNLVCYNFQFQLQESAEIVKRKITIYYTFVRSKEYGYPDGAFNSFYFSNSYEGMGDDLSFKVEREPGEEVGQYELYFIEPYEGANNNFDITLGEDYVYTIRPRRVLIEAQSTTKIYGEEDPTINFWLSSKTPLPNGVLFEELVLGTPSRMPGENAGFYRYTLGSLKVEQAESSRYKLEISSNGLTITARAIEIKIDDQTKEYGEPTPEFTFEIVSGSLAFDSDLKILTNSTDNAGTWRIYASISKLNYNVVCDEGVYTITPAPLTVGPLNGSKIYGEEDPELKVEIVFGSLKKDDTLLKILLGKLEREEGEEVGTYEISQGTLTSNGNYKLTYTGSATFEIFKREVTVTPDEINLFLDQLPFTGELTYKTSPALVGTDSLEGKLEVEEIVGLGKFKISQGTLSSKNYSIIFVEGYVTVSKRPLVIETVSHQKVYDTNPFSQPSFIILPESNLMDGHDKQYLGIVAKVSQDANVGEYPIIIEYGLVDGVLDEQRKQEIEKYYDIQIKTGTLKITPANVAFTIDNYVLTYGETLPTSNDLTYSVTSGTNYNNEIIVNLSWENNKNAGEYEIIATFSGDENYQITCKNGKVIINKKQISVNISDANKTYGEKDPALSYQIGEGLLQGDQLFESIKRKEGEDAGKYEIVFNHGNPNYAVTTNQAYLTINPRPLYVTIFASDKVYDGTDKVQTSFELENLLENDLVVLTLSARFANPQIGDNKEIVYACSLSGEDGNNYAVEVLKKPTANITRKTITNGSVSLTVSDDNTILTEGVSLVVERVKSDHFTTIEGRETLFEYQIVLMKGGVVLENVGKVSIEIKLLEQDPENFDLFFENSETQINYRIRTKKLSFETEDLGNFFAVKQIPSKTLMYVLIGFGSAAGVAGIVTAAVLIARKKAQNKKRRRRI